MSRCQKRLQTTNSDVVEVAAQKKLYPAITGTKPVHKHSTAHVSTVELSRLLEASQTLAAHH